MAYQPTGDLETLKVGEIFNITRVLFLPLIVLWLAVWYVRRETAAIKARGIKAGWTCPFRKLYPDVLVM